MRAVVLRRDPRLMLPERGAHAGHGGKALHQLCGEGNATVYVSKSEAPQVSAGLRDKRGRRGSNPQPPDRQSGTLTN